MNCGSHGYQPSLNSESTHQQACPQIEPLLDVTQVSCRYTAAVGVHQLQTYAPEVQAMRVFAQPFVQLSLAFGVDGVSDLTAVGFKHRQTKFPCPKLLRLWRSMPTPL